MKQSENWIISKLFNNNSSQPAYSLVWVRRKICQHYKRSRLRYLIFQVVTLIRQRCTIFSLRHLNTLLYFFPLRSFLLPPPTALLRPVADSELVKSSNMSYTWHSRGNLRCRDSDSKEKVKKSTGRIFDRRKIRTFTRIRDHDFSQAATRRCNIFAILFRMVATLFQHCNAVLRRIVSYNITLTVRKFRRTAVQSSVWTAKNIERSRVNDVSGQIFLAGRKFFKQ